MRQLLPSADVVDPFVAYAQRHPGVRVNFASSVDGAATVDGRSDGLSSPADKQLFRVLRALCDVVMVGAGTARIEKYGPVRPPAEHRQWRLEHGMPPVPPLAVVSASLALDTAGPFFAEAAVRPLVLTGPDAPPDRVRVLSAVADVLVGDTVTSWLAQLADRGLARVLCEGGPRLFGSLLTAGHVDELCLTLSPILSRQAAISIAEPQVQSRPTPLHLVHVLTEDGFLFLRYASKKA